MKKIIILSCVMLLLCSGCALFQRNTTLGSSSEPKQEGPNQVFYGFPDVPIPQELSLVNDRSFVYETSSLQNRRTLFNAAMLNSSPLKITLK